MIQEIGNKKFDNQYKNIQPKETDYIFFFTGTDRRNDQILLREEDGVITLPRICDIKKILEKTGQKIDQNSNRDIEEFNQKISENSENEIDEKLLKNARYLFSIDEDHFFLCEDEMVLETEFSFHPIKVLRKNNPGYLCFAGMTAYHLFSWYRDSRFCGQCGAETVHDGKLRMKKCSNCNHMIFPKIAPAVIIGLRDGDRLMLSKYAGREYKGRALLAGFCEIGETPEETVVREVMEEVGLKATNVTYYGSQPWGFDSNLLLGYFADVDGDTKVTMDEEELAVAEFVKREDIEYEPNHMSLTATMIEEFRLGNW